MPSALFSCTYTHMGEIAPPNQPVIVRVSEAECVSGQPSQQTVLDAIIALNEDGLVILDNAIDLAHIDALNERMTTEAFELMKRPTTHVNSPGNISQVPPITPELFFEDIFANPIAGAVIEGTLGPRPEVRYLNGNTAMRGTARQDPHADLAWPHWRGAFGLVVNVMLVEATEENGATEVWLGTHRDTTLADHIAPNKGAIQPELLEARRAVRPPVQPHIPKGALIIRDLRLWHAGMPNSTDTPRCMLAIVHSPAWIGNRLLLEMPESVKPIIDGWDSKVKYCAEYVPDDQFDNLAVEFKYDMGPGGGLPKDERVRWDQEWSKKWGNRFH